MSADVIELERNVSRKNYYIPSVLEDLAMRPEYTSVVARNRVQLSLFLRSWWPVDVVRSTELRARLTEWAIDWIECRNDA